MSRRESILSILASVAQALGDYRSEVVFVGGSIVGLLITQKDPFDVRPTDDVDVVVNAGNYSKYSQLLESLRGLGFRHDKDGPTCRLLVGGIKVDIMPTTEILGFRNRWYPEVIATARKMQLHDSTEINVVHAPLFICTKLDAFNDRGKGDYIGSSDIEDIISVVIGRPELLSECFGSSLEVRIYLKKSFEKLLGDRDFTNALPGLLPYGATNLEGIVYFRIGQLAQLPIVESFSGSVMINYATTPTSIAVITMNGSTQLFATREFERSEDLLQCIEELGIKADPARIKADGFNELYMLKGIGLDLLVRWGLLRPLN